MLIGVTDDAFAATLCLGKVMLAHVPVPRSLPLLLHPSRRLLRRRARVRVRARVRR